MNQPATQHDTQSDQRGGGSRFAFSSGARPLEGYTLERGVGRGGFGEVYFALSDAGKEVALKLIRRNLDIELRGVNHCLNLKHPNLIALYDVRQDDQDNSWVIMEFVAGESLEEAIRSNPNGMPVGEVLDWIRGIATGAAYLHSHGIVHRDLKPANVFRDEASGGLVKLGDYGLSKFISCSRRSGQTESIGTVHYMAPEIANGRYGKEIDIYALGIILYEMLTGRVPFDGESVGEVLMKHLTAEPELSALAEPFRTVVRRALAKDPHIRYASIDEFMAALPPPPPRAAAFHPALGNAPPYPPPPAGTPANEESFWETASKQFQDVVGRLNQKEWTPLNVFLVIGATLLMCFVLLFVVYLLLFEGGLLLGRSSILVLLLIAFAVYRVTRPSRRLPHQRHAMARPQAGPPPVPRNLPRQVVRNTRELERAAIPLILKTPRERLAELSGSLLFAAIAALILSVVMGLVWGPMSQAQQYAWLTFVSTLGAWAVLIFAKLWEGTHGDSVLRHFVMLVVGLCVGVAAYGCHQALMVDLPYEMSPRTIVPRMSEIYYRTLDGSPMLSAYLAHFGFLFLVVPWWRQADPCRRSRLGLLATAFPGAVSWLLTILWPFPQPWGMMTAITIAVSVQLASPWSGQKDR